MAFLHVDFSSSHLRKNVFALLLIIINLASPASFLNPIENNESYSREPRLPTC